MEYCIVVVAIKTVLEEVPAGKRKLLCPELERDVAGGGVEDAGGGGLRLEVIEGGHFGERIETCKLMRLSGLLARVKMGEGLR